MVDTGPRPGYQKRKASIVDDVASHANLRRDVVEDVLKAFVDIAAERLLNERKLVLSELLSVRTVVTKNGIRPEPHLQFRAKVATGLRKLLQKMEENPGLEVNRRNWREEARKLTGRRTPATMKLTDFLADDDEDS